MRDIIIIFAILLVLLLLISTLGGSIRHNGPPPPRFAAQYPPTVTAYPTPMSMMGSPLSEGFETEQEEENVNDTYVDAQASAALNLAAKKMAPPEASGDAAPEVTHSDMGVEPFAQRDKEFAEF